VLVPGKLEAPLRDRPDAQWRWLLMQSTHKYFGNGRIPALPAVTLPQ